MVNISSRAATPRDQQDLLEISEFLLSQNELSGNSKLLEHYENLLCQLFKVKYAIPVSSGTAAIHCALAALNITYGDEVIIPVTGAVMSAIPIIAIGATPVFVDCQKDSFAICIKSLKKNISHKTKAIISVPMWGYPIYNNELNDLASLHNIPIIEDAAQAIGSINKGKYEGTNSAIGCFSTHELKLISTGEGGFILTDDLKLANKCRAYSKIGFDSSNIEAAYGINMGLNYKLNAVTAALGCSQIKKLEHRLNIRKENAGLWLKYLSDCKNLYHISKNEIDSKPNYYGLALLLDKEIVNINSNFSKILFNNGIGTDVYRYKYKMLCQYPLFEKYYVDDTESLKKDFSNAYDLIPRLVVLPTHEDINEDIIIESSTIIKNLIKTEY